MPADPFVALERTLARYRSDVHQLAPGASSEALVSLEGHLALALPAGLRQFLARHNGGSLFRGALRLRSASEVATASATAREVVLFADGVPAPDARFGSDERRWAWAPDGVGGHVFGPWEDDKLDPIYGSFGAWFCGEVALLDARVTRTEDQDALRLEAAPDDVHLLVRAGERALRLGRPEEAEGVLRRATAADPDGVRGWQRLGDVLALSDRTAARMAWLQGLRKARFPLAWPGATGPEPEVFRQLGPAFADPADWEREIERFLTEQVRDVRTAGEAAVVVAAALELSRSHERRGDRTGARDVLTELLSRCRLFAYKETPWAAVLELTRLETDLGHHDEAEGLLRRLRREPHPSEVDVAEAALALGRIAVIRQEPWAEEILDEALAGPLDDRGKLEAWALRCERAVRQERPDEANRCLAEARAAARRAGGGAAAAAFHLVESDVARLEQRTGEAVQAARRGLEALGEPVSLPGTRAVPDPEVRGRLHLRLGDLALAAARTGPNRDPRRADEAWEHFQVAARLFKDHGFPVREAWTLVRIATIAREPGTVLEAARARFAEADLAAGIAACDAIRGDPGTSLPWHLERATAHARARFDAQRCRPPWDRADADRPERRLGAHRVAIAACDEGVVDALSRELDANARAISVGRGRALDPPVMQYVAAVDLLAAHRSFPAARVLLDHLLRARVDGPAQRALAGAVVRSTNAALVDGLLSCVENPSSWPSDAVSTAAEILGLRREREAVKALAVLAGPKQNPISRKAALVALGRVGDRGVVERLVPALDEPALAEPAALALLMLGDRRGVDFHGRALEQGLRDLSGSAGEIVGRYGGPSYLPLLAATAEGEDERAVGAIQGVGLLGDPRGVPTLLRAVGHRDKRVVEVASGALQILLGHAEDPEEHGVARRWAQWWETNGDGFRPGVRHRDGRIFDHNLLITRMDHDDPWVRRTAYDELVITTGSELPFDLDGPWRVQRTHLRAWHAWWAGARAKFVPGRWYLDGARIA